jgi:hypothetical protein
MDATQRLLHGPELGEAGLAGKRAREGREEKNQQD